MRRSRKTFHTEQSIDKVYSLLIDDLSPGTQWFGFRSYSGPNYSYAGPYTFKRLYQLEAFYKRIITSRDVPFEVLASKAEDDFKESQKKFGLPNPLTPRQSRVLSRARQICESILGEFQIDEFLPLCDFGKKAARHLPYRKSYLDTRMVTLNGTRSQFEWFKLCLSKDIHLNRAYRLHKNFVEVDDIELKAVPKSYKSARTIAPDTILGGFLSRGLGDLIRRKLETGTKINLATQQELHKVLAKASSVKGHLATLDMSKASDSFVWEHICALIPDSWHSILRAVHVPNVLIRGERIPLRSYMLMGSGHTFPLQTLLFYCLSKAVVELMGSTARVYVYGDDIIVPAVHADKVVTCLVENGFTINTEKSFLSGPFRESCGGDFHTGLDVRPFMLEHTCTEVGMHEYLALLHKMINGLQDRWAPEEIPGTLTYLHAEIVRVLGKINVVPENETDDAGVKSPLVTFTHFCSFPKYIDGLPVYYKLAHKAKRRKPRYERVYYWRSLRPKGLLQPYDEAPSSLDEKGREVMKGSHRYCWLASAA